MPENGDRYAGGGMSGISFPKIGAACREKRDLEKDFFRWSENLYKSLPSFQKLPGISMAVFEARVIEIYRLCYEHSPAETRMGILRDFAAHFPHLIFEAKWLNELMRRSHHYGVGAGSFQSRLFLSVATGLRSAASGTRYGRQTRALKLHGARMARLRLYEELDSWNRALERSLDPSREWIDELASAKTQELTKENPRLNRVREQLLRLLQAGKMYDASVLVIAHIFGIRQRDLEQRG
jgi:hypothetical protein